MSSTTADSQLQSNTLPHEISIVLFSRFPKPGKVKTRLAWRIGDGAAAHIHRHMLNGILATLVTYVKNVNIVLNYTGADCEQSMRKAFYPDVDTKSVQFIKQPDLSFGERVSYIAQRLNKFIIVSSDIPQLSVAQINEAIAYVENNQSVIGLTEDGGYYLIGLPEYRDVFTSVDYRANDVGQQTFSLMQTYFNQAHQLKKRLIDVDEEQDLQALDLEHLIEGYVDISVIIPVLNESDNIVRMLEHTLTTASEIDRIEIIIVDGCSRDNTVALVADFKERFADVKLHLFVIPSLGRSFQMNYGFRRSSGRFSLFCHADTLLPEHWDSKIKDNFHNAHIKWCHFGLRYDNPHRALRFIAWVASNLRRVPYGDQALCFRRDYFTERGKFDYLTLLEDARLMYVKVSSSEGNSLADSALTSARMYANKQGKLTYRSIVKIMLRNNAILIGAWLLKIPPCLLKSLYYRNVRKLNIIEVDCLNQRYAFQYHYPEKLKHKIIIWKTFYYQHCLDRIIGEMLKHIKGNDIIVDVGANVGMLSILLAISLTKQHISSQIIAFEHSQKLRDSFQYNHSLYQQEIKNRITLESKDCVDNTTTQTITLDNYRFQDKPISIIAVNVEKSWRAVLEGMQETLRQHRPVVLFQLTLYSNTCHCIKKFLRHSQTDQRNTIDNFFNRIDYNVEKLSKVHYVAHPK